MNILIIGGTRFLGRHLVNAALERGHSVTLFNRGQTNPGLFNDVEQVRGDREKDLSQLAGEWDAVIDTCGYLPRIVRMSAEALIGKVKKYVFISSISVYSDLKKIGINEDDPVGRIDDETIEEITGETYGPLKVLCEKAVWDVFGDGALIVRPGLIVGPHDPTDRFTYWPVRVARGGAVLAPEKPEVPVQIIDVRDLSDFIIGLLGQNAKGVFNATGPGDPLTLGDMLDACKHAGGSGANFKWASVKFLEDNQVAPWSDMPVWIPDTEEEAGFSRVDISKALQAGLKFLPLETTVRDTLQWASARPEDHQWKAGLSAEREKQLLDLLNVQ